MCGRIYIRPSASSSIVLNAFNLHGAELPKRNNVAPTGQIPVIHQEGDEIVLRDMRWWLHPSWETNEPNNKPARFNARVETVLTLNSFRSVIKRQRGIVPIDAFVEWQKVGAEKLPWYIEGKSEPLAVAAIWDLWHNEVYSCAIITQPATESFAKLHDRMPMSLTLDQARRWINPNEKAPELLNDFGHATVELKERRIDKEMNSIHCKNDPIFID